MIKKGVISAKGLMHRWCIKPFLDSLKKELSKNVYFYYGRVYTFQVVSLYVREGLFTWNFRHVTIMARPYGPWPYTNSIKITETENHWIWSFCQFFKLCYICTYLDLKTTFYGIVVILSSVGILFHEDSTFCSEVTCFERNAWCFHIFIVTFQSSGVNYSICAVWVNP